MNIHKNLKSFISGLSPTDFDLFVTKVHYFVLKENKNVEKAEVKRIIERFKFGKTRRPTGRYLEAYVHVIDLLGYSVADVIQGTGKKQKTFKQLYISSLPADELPKELQPHFDDEKVQESFKDLLETMIEYVKDDDKEKFQGNLDKFNAFLKITWF
ncbi:hypothetical protein [Bacillus sp. EB01]|uniref:hypothetical protein n=1 Tax=Bacillus sp. EB01 TaxID=1347086 RepID=UPI0005C4473B|nr:hypothetical protein [Bacillus sp. EB01]